MRIILQIPKFLVSILPTTYTLYMLPALLHPIKSVIEAEVRHSNVKKSCWLSILYRVLAALVLLW